MYVTQDRALLGTNNDELVKEIADRVEVLDALYRFGLGQDLRDKDLFASAFAEDAELDFQPAASKWGGYAPLMCGRDTIVNVVLNMFEGRVDTTHVVTNPRITVNKESASLTAIVEAQHLLSADHSQQALLKNLYAVDLLRSGERWVIQRLRIDNVWYTGDPNVIFSPH